MIFKASWDVFTKILNLAITVLYLGIAGTLVFSGEDLGPLSSLTIGVILLLSYFAALAFMPVHYRVTQDQLIVQRPFDKISIAKSEIATVEILSDDSLKWSIRVFGSGGMFGYFGRFYN